MNFLDCTWISKQAQLEKFGLWKQIKFVQLLVGFEIEVRLTSKRQSYPHVQDEYSYPGGCSRYSSWRLLAIEWRWALSAGRSCTSRTSPTGTPSGTAWPPRPRTAPGPPESLGTWSCTRQGSWRVRRQRAPAVGSIRPRTSRRLLTDWLTHTWRDDGRRREVGAAEESIEREANLLPPHAIAPAKSNPDDRRTEHYITRDDRKRDETVITLRKNLHADLNNADE